ncbi:MAG: hypothetical protein CBC13_04390 [Planctomycetia bacterium TMED53]|nr:MAG: hypothetical protein CBC13_04390 [Planctomycetia bacterium TMED53]
MAPPTRPFIFDDTQIDRSQLRKTAFNLRWATVEEDVIPLTAGEMDFPIAEPVSEAIQRHAREGYLGYCPKLGFETLREAICEDLSNRSISASPDRILVLDGAAAALKAACRAILNPGDEAVTFDPVDFLLPHCSELAGAKVLRCPVSPIDGSINFEALESLISSKTKALLICNPHNPTGRVLRKEELSAMANLAEKHNLTIISDEVWSEIIIGTIPMTSIASLSDEIRKRTITISGFSKSDGLSGMRVGYLHCENETIFNKIVDFSGVLDTTSGATALSQVAAEAALKEGGPWRSSFVEHLKSLVPYTADQLSQLAGVDCPKPEGTFLLFPSVSAFDMDCESLAEFILTEARVAVVPGAERWFGSRAKGHLRLSVATSRSVVDAALERLSALWGQQS